jgi:UDP:flavonoid glycosyltransferase YjiC (YdhE family)
MPMPADARKRVLLFAEAVTLAHVARPVCFARGLDRSRYRVAIAVASHAARHVAAAGIEHLALDSIEPRRFLAALAQGRALYDDDTLQRYVQSDLALIERFAPDVVVGDFRLSLSVSARLAHVPYVNIASAYWSPYYVPPGWPVPSLPLTRFLPLGLAQAVFSVARPAAFVLHCGPFNRVSVRHGLPPLPRDLRCVYTDADIVAYSDLPELFPLYGAPPTHRFLGPVLWQPAGELPEWWDQLPADRPCLYVTLGSSGDARLLPRIVEALAPLPVTLLVASAASLPFTLPSNVFAAPYLPGLLAAQRSRLVVCNGGNLTAYQALAAGVPVLGIAGNLDQLLNMQAFERAGVGHTLRADRFTSGDLRTAVEAILGGSGHIGAVKTLSHSAAASAFDARVAALIGELVG